MIFHPLSPVRRGVKLRGPLSPQVLHEVHIPLAHCPGANNIREYAHAQLHLMHLPLRLVQAGNLSMGSIPIRLAHAPTSSISLAATADKRCPWWSCFMAAPRQPLLLLRTRI